MRTIVVDSDCFLEHEPHRFSAEASELRFPPGYWPKAIETKKPFGNGRPFLFSDYERDSDDDITLVRYRQHLGCVVLMVFND